MKAICITEPGKIEVLEREMPRVSAPDDVLIRVRCVGICGSDVHIFHGQNPFAVYPRVWGHEFTGTVEAVGSGVTDLQPGDHVVGEPYLSCGTCYACRKGRGNVCKDIQVFGVHRDGGCQEYLTMPRYKVHKVDAGLPWHIAVLAEPLTIGFQSVSRGRVEAGDLVLVMGAGTIGTTVLMAAKSLGARVCITDLFDEKLAYAKKFGADWRVNVSRESVEDAFGRIGEPPNVVIDAVGNQKSLEQAAELVSPAGRVVELGFSPAVSGIPHVTLMRKEVDLCGTRLQSGRFPLAVRYIEEHSGLLDDFVTQRFALDEAAEAFRYVTENAALVRKAVVMMEG